MTTAVQIGIGIWLGGLFLTGTFAGCFALQKRIERNWRYGAPWHRGIFSS